MYRLTPLYEIYSIHGEPSSQKIGINKLPPPFAYTLVCKLYPLDECLVNIIVFCWNSEFE